MKEGQIISRLFIEKNGKMEQIIIRAPKESDLMGVWKFYNKAIKETEFLSRITPVKLKDERKWLERAINDMKKKNSAYLLAECDGKIIASANANRELSEVNRHIGDFGICILQEYTGCGIGTKITAHILELARKDMKIEIAKLSVYHKNKIAQGLYKKMGFKYAGKIPKGVKRGKGRYMDNITMYKVL